MKYKNSHLIGLQCELVQSHGKLIELEKTESNSNGWETTKGLIKTTKLQRK